MSTNPVGAQRPVGIALARAWARSRLRTRLLRSGLTGSKTHRRTRTQRSSIHPPSSIQRHLYSRRLHQDLEVAPGDGDASGYLGRPQCRHVRVKGFPSAVLRKIRPVAARAGPTLIPRDRDDDGRCSDEPQDFGCSRRRKEHNSRGDDPDTQRDDRHARTSTVITPRTGIARSELRVARPPSTFSGH
jgi:hypothetical protein